MTAAIDKALKALEDENKKLRARMEAMEARNAPPQPQAPKPFQYPDGIARDARGQIISNVTEEQYLARHTLTPEQRRDLGKAKNCEYDASGNWRGPDGQWRRQNGELIVNYGKERIAEEVPPRVPAAQHRGGLAERLVDAATPLRMSDATYTRMSE